jgi:hypothetical protein
MTEMFRRLALALTPYINHGIADAGEAVRAALEAMRYEDGTDEDIAISIGDRLHVDPVTAIECHDAWIDAALGSGP